MMARICSPSLTFAGLKLGAWTTRLPCGGTKNLSASWMVQLASSLLISFSFPCAGLAITATSSKPSPLKSPTMNHRAVPCSQTKSSPKTRCMALSTSAMVGGGSLGKGSGVFSAWGVATGIGFSTRASLGAFCFPQPISSIKIMAAPRHTAMPNIRRLILVPRKDEYKDFKDKTGEALDSSASPAKVTATTLQRVQERNQLVLLSGAQCTVVVDHTVGLAVVTQNGIIPRERQKVMHQSKVGTHSPQGRGAHLVGCGLSAVLDNAVPGSHVVQQEVAERVEGLIAQRRRHSELPLVDHGPSGNGGDRRHVADGATDGVEDVSASLRVRSRRQRGVARRGLGGAHKAGKNIDGIKSVGFHFVLRIVRGLAPCTVVGGVEPLCDALLVQACNT